MVYSTAPNVQAQVPGIATSKGGAQAFVQRLVMQTVFDVLELQARSALLPDAVISAILDQLTVNITYEPMDCPAVAITLMEPGRFQIFHPLQKIPKSANGAGMTPLRCIIVGDTVTGICTGLRNEGMCKMSEVDKSMVTNVPANLMSISGTLTTRNIIMANWSRMMWQNVLNRAVRMLAARPFGSHFFSASATVGGS
ncbi:hypothetical protein KIN20_011972 [Parelaphostrongylus tenuis]|uniref:Uncharacterized protein n=1 Tax=Parelaphostrongylus tenuis TaxID=148309 RepID=A0AAD5MVR4_PARTN|nr:hypothetical protein KIN20_011972 [Parelaphostrongylus tenuis]